MSRLLSDLEYIKRFRLMDDDFMSMVFEGRPDIAEIVIQTILKQNDIVVKDLKVQHEIKGLYGHSVRFDVNAVDRNNKQYDIEIQRADKGASPQQARYNSALLDSTMLCKNDDYTKLKDSYVIFITENDIFKKGQALYHIERKIEELDDYFNDGSHIIFVNGEYTGNDEIGDLMNDFRSSEVSDIKNEIISKRVKYLKETEEGIVNMCKMMEEMRTTVAKESAIDTATKIAKIMLKNGEPVEKIVKYSKLSKSKVIQLAKEMKIVCH